MTDELPIEYRDLHAQIIARPFDRHLAVKLANLSMNDADKDAAIGALVRLQKSCQNPISSVLLEIIKLRGASFLHEALPYRFVNLKNNVLFSAIERVWQNILLGLDIDPSDADALDTANIGEIELFFAINTNTYSKI